jgi:hypoxanthine-DNA glycosylase
MRLEHPYEPIFDSKSSVLILGTLPSIKSREYGYYYGHPQNRFWKVIAAITKTITFPTTIAAKKRMLLTNGIALTDVLQSCEIEGSSDSKIRNPSPRDLVPILNSAPIKHIYANGIKAYQILLKYFPMGFKIAVTKLPSTSPANAQYTLDQLIAEWRNFLFISNENL